MTRLTNDNTDVNQKVDHGSDAQISGTGPEAAGKDSFARQANKGILAEAVAQELNVRIVSGPCKQNRKVWPEFRTMCQDALIHQSMGRI